jgi:zinc protease
LVEGELAASVSGSLMATIDPFLYSFHVVIRPDRDPEHVLKVFDEEIQKVLESPVEVEALEKAIKQARALFAYSSESITNQAFWLGYSEMFADYDWFESYLDRLTAVDSQAVLDVARKYLLESKRVIGIYRPAEGGSNG